MTKITDRTPGAPTGRDADAELPPVPDEYQPYRPLSLLALGGLGLSVLSAVLVCVGGWISVYFHWPKTFLFLIVLAPGAAALVCLLLGVTQPLRILKTAGFALAGVLAVLGLGGLLAYSGSNPWLLPVWLLVLPLAGLLLLWIGRTQIVRSEDTLSGLPLCNWGMGIVAVFGLVYLAYYAATVMAVRLESEVFAKQWVDRLGKGEVDGAFLLTLPPEQRPPENAETRSKLETLFNQPGPRNEGVYSAFATKDFVRLIAGAPGDAKVESPRLMEWKYEDGQFQVLYQCRVVSSVCAFDLDVFARGIVNAKGQTQGRQWYVDMMRTGRNPAEPPQFTAKGQSLLNQIGPAREFAQGWIEKWYRDDDEAYLETLPRARREELQTQQLLLGAALGGAAPWTKPPRGPYADGALVEADSKTFYAARPAYREAIPAKLRESFRPGRPKPDRAMLSPASSLPIMQPTANGARLVFDARMLFDKDTQPVDVDARVVVECDAASLESKHPQWRVAQIQLIRARSVQMPPGEPGGPGGPGPNRPLELP
jgi:hypothetical protein